MRIQLRSPSFNDGEPIPAKFTCDGENISPALTWSTNPAGTKTLAVVMDDPDAPRGTWVHWVLYDLPFDMQELPEGLSSTETLPGGGTQGKNSWNKLGYGGPCPPSGTHRYIFRLYALDKSLGIAAGATKLDLFPAMEGHIIGEGQLIGLYSR